MWLFYLFLVFPFSLISSSKIETVLTTELFEIILSPSLFNWTYEGISNQFTYQASLRNHPDLPQWIKYIFSQRHHSGFLYGVPPINYSKQKLQLEVVALNKKNYETRLEYINIHISDKLKPAKYEVHMKIDNLNVDDVFEVDRMESLKNIFKKQLWKDSADDLYVTFMESAIQLGARKPPDPNEGDGVVLRLGSESSLSLELIELQEEIKPLWKVPSCPRDYKRTSVERFFRKAGFVLDWCSFRLIDNGNSALHHSNEELKSIGNHNDRWNAIRKSDVPRRSYTKDFIFTILIPIVFMIILSLILSVILCFHHEKINDPLSEDFFNNLYHICTDYFDSTKTMSDYLKHYHQHDSNDQCSLEGSSSKRDILNPDPMLLMKTTSSPNSSLNRGIHCRPSPPPYVRPKFKPTF